MLKIITYWISINFRNNCGIVPTSGNHEHLYAKKHLVACQKLWFGNILPYTWKALVDDAWLCGIFHEGFIWSWLAPGLHPGGPGPPTAWVTLHEAADGYAAPKAPAGQSCLDGEYFNAWPRQYDYASIVFLWKSQHHKATKCDTHLIRRPRRISSLPKRRIPFSAEDGDWAHSYHLGR